ncbi:hypothetical protein KDL29_16245 [bacterium]|nr:hypothetical protein [bacterium]
MRTLDYLKLISIAALALLLCGCPQGGNERPGRGRWAGQDSAGGGEASGSPQMGEAQSGDAASDPADTSDTPSDGDQTDSGEAVDDGAADDGSADTGQDDSSAESDEAGEEDGSADEQPCAGDGADEASEDTEDDAGQQAPPAPPAQSGSIDLSGEWLALFGRNPQGVRSELWKSGKTYTISGDVSALTIRGTDGSALSQGSEEVLRNVSLMRSGPFLTVDRGSSGSIAYMQAGANAMEFAQSGKFKGSVSGTQVNGSYRRGANGLKLESEDGFRFDGELRDGAWCGFLEAGRTRGYCVIVGEGNGKLTGILFVDPYMSFNARLSFEIVE